MRQLFAIDLLENESFRYFEIAEVARVICLAEHDGATWTEVLWQLAEAPGGFEAASRFVRARRAYVRNCPPNSVGEAMLETLSAFLITRAEVIFVLGADGQVLTANPAALRLPDSDFARIRARKLYLRDQRGQLALYALLSGPAENEATSKALVLRLRHKSEAAIVLHCFKLPTDGLQQRMRPAALIVVERTARHLVHDPAKN